ncbi:MAG TPA: DUF1326 domain-containing protein [Gaiellaceae bacterium]|jgi:hypothetical protein|nr:DUF1326 domain-containing protein [Gaiellaceae bacterium]
MAYTIKGTYVASCNCVGLCPCPVDGTPTAEGGQCRGAAAFAINEGNLDDTDLGGVNFALYNYFPSNITAGNWKVGIVVDDGASDEQAQAIERIISGDEGGPFGDFKPLIGDYAGMERASIIVSDGSVTVAGKSEYTFEPYTGPDGSPTIVRGAMFGFAPEFQVGKTTGESDAFDLSFQSSYGEKAEFEYSTEAVGAVHPRA